MNAKALQEDLESLNFTPILAKSEMKKEIGVRRASSKQKDKKWSRGGQKVAGDRAAGLFGWLVGLPLLFLGMEVWREHQSRFTPSISN